MYEYNCNIVKVVDGDTVDVDIDLGFGMWLRNERVRLYGIDTPECRTRDPEEKLCGMYAKKVVQDYLPKGKPAAQLKHIPNTLAISTLTCTTL